MTFTLESFHFHVLPMHTRFPFKYGIASMNALPHLFVTANLVVDGKAVSGLASEGLPPKWFTKNPDTPFELDLAEMIAVIQNASRIARLAAEKPTGFFTWWQNLYAEQSNWAKVKEVPSLLANLGVSLIERSVLDGLCKALGQPLHSVLRSDVLGIDLGAVREELRGMRVADVIAPAPLTHVNARHTVGLGDPLSAADGTLDDGLRPDRSEPTRLGRRVQRHDGLLDITRQSDLVTVSWSHFRNHDKTSLVGSGDRAVADDGHGDGVLGAGERAGTGQRRSSPSPPLRSAASRAARAAGSSHTSAQILMPTRTPSCSKTQGASPDST